MIQEIYDSMRLLAIDVNYGPAGTDSVIYSRPACAAFAIRTAFGMAVARFVVPSRQPIPESSAATFTVSICGVNYSSKLASSLKIDMTLRTLKDSLKESRNLRNGS